MKRLRTPKLADGELRIYWGREPHGYPEIMFAWQGDRSMTVSYTHLTLPTNREV